VVLSAASKAFAGEERTRSALPARPSSVHPKDKAAYPCEPSHRRESRRGSCRRTPCSPQLRLEPHRPPVPSPSDLRETAPVPARLDPVTSPKPNCLAAGVFCRKRPVAPCAPMSFGERMKGCARRTAAFRTAHRGDAARIAAFASTLAIPSRSSAFATVLRWREPRTTAGTAEAMTSSSRTDRRAFRKLVMASAAPVELRERSRMAEDVMADKSRLAHCMREQLWRYCPQMLGIAWSWAQRHTSPAAPGGLVVAVDRNPLGTARRA
jgi:hypothetical protein